MSEISAELRDRPLFICGHPKSGTSLLRSLLDSHPQLVVYPEETGFFRRYLPASQGLGLAEKLDLADERLIHFFTWNQVKPPPSQSGFPDRDYSSVPFDKVRFAMWQQLTEWGYRHDGDLLSAAVLAYGQVTGQLSADKRWWVEKTPYNERFTDQIFTWWPAARCIHIVRDPRDNYASYQLKHPEWTPEVFGYSWGGSTQLGLGNVEKFGRDRYWLLRYEDLTKHPEEALAKLCQFLEITGHASLQTPTRKGTTWQGNSMFADRFGQISGAPVERWKKILTKEEAGVIVFMTSRWMKRLRYPISGLVPLRAALRAILWQARRRIAGGIK